MLKDDICVIGMGLGGERIAYAFQQKNYTSYLINGSKQDNQTLGDAKNVLVLDGYDGMAGDRALAYEALKNNKGILKKIKDIEQDIVLLCATGGGTTGSGTIPHLANIACSLQGKTVCAVLMMPRRDEAIQKRINAYNAAKELMENPDMGAVILVNNESYDDLGKINYHLVSMLDAFFTDNSVSAESNFDDSEKRKMLADNGMFTISMLCDKDGKMTTTQDMINSLTAKNIFLPVGDSGIVSHIGIINQKGNKMDEKEIVRAVGTPENVFIGCDGHINIVAISGLAFPVSYLTEMGKAAISEQKERVEKRKAFSILDDLDIVDDIKIVERKISKNRQVSLDLLADLD
jgi:hypothetical protein